MSFFSPGLPKVIETFFDASNKYDVPLLTGCLTENAVLNDNGKTFNGHGVIAEYICGTHAKLSIEVKVEHVVFTENETVVTAKLYGNYDGSPAALDFHFSLEGQRIKCLNIVLAGE
jgi:hypothetical protein